MADNTSGLFLDPQQIFNAQQQLGRQQDMQVANMAPGRGIVALASHLGRLAGNIPRLFGATTPEEQAAAVRQKALNEAYVTAGSDPQAFLSQAAKNLLQVGDYQGALQLTDKINEMKMNQAKMDLIGAQTVDTLGNNPTQLALQESKAKAAQTLEEFKQGQANARLQARLSSDLKIANSKNAIDYLKNNQDYAIKQGELRVHIDRANSYQEAVQNQNQYWSGVLNARVNELAEKKSRNTNLNLQGQLRIVQGQVARGYAHDNAVSAAYAVQQQGNSKFGNLTRDQIDKLPTKTIMNMLPPDVRIKVGNTVGTFVSKLSPINPTIASELNQPTDQSISKYASDQPQTSTQPAPEGTPEGLYVDLYSQQGKNK